MTTTTNGVTAMTCEHCASAVKDELTKLPGVREIAVDLVPEGISSVHVVSDEPLDDARVREAVDEAGYELADATQ